MLYFYICTKFKKFIKNNLKLHIRNLYLFLLCYLILIYENVNNFKDIKYIKIVFST